MSEDTALSYWDSQFRFSAIFPEFAERLERAAQESQRITEDLVLEKLAYGEAERQFVELTSARPHVRGPIPVFIHGGYWRALSAADHRFVLPGLLSSSTQAANVEYRLMPSNRMSDLVDDVANAVQIVRERTGGHLILIGHSAGAHLALAAASRIPDAQSSLSLILVSGVYDLEPVRWSFLQDEIALSDAEVRDWSFSHAGFKIPAPAMFVVGGRETHEFQRQAEIMARRHRCPILRSQGDDHMSILWSLADPASNLSQALKAFIGTGRASATHDGETI